MFKLEKKFIDALIEKRVLLFIGIITILGVFIRTKNFAFQSEDYLFFLSEWDDEIKGHGGLPALKYQIGDYNITYQFIICVMTYLPINKLYMYKLISLVFDMCLAWAVGKLLGELSPQNKEIFFIIGYTFVMVCPTIVMNSSMWAQCDSIYSFFVIMSLRKLFAKKDISAFIYLGIAFAFKLQAVFVLPFFVYVYISERRFSILNFLYAVGSFYVLGLPGVIARKNLMAPFMIYMKQTTNQNRTYFNLPNFWAMFFDFSNTVGRTGIALTLGILGILLFIIVKWKYRIGSSEEYITLAAWSCFTMVMFLPNMHDRYLYLTDILLTLLAVVNRKYVVYAVIAVLMSFVSYDAYLHGKEDIAGYYPFIYVVVWACFTVTAARSVYDCYKQRATIQTEELVNESNN